MGLIEKASKIEEMEKARMEKYSLPSERNPVEYTEFIENLKMHLSNEELQQFNQQSAEIEGEYSNECIYCGSQIIDWAFEPFEEDADLFSLKLKYSLNN